MVSRSAIQDIAARAEAQRGNLATEEAAKVALVLPMLQALGYDVFNPQEVVPEFTADYAARTGKKVDFAIIRDGAPVMLVECKKVGDPLDPAARDWQLPDYFNRTSARIAVLTDGIVYKFFSDLDAENVMDAAPFFEVDITKADQRDMQALSHFAKHTFDLEEARSAASRMKQIGGMKDYLAEMYRHPDDDFTRLLARRVFSGPLFANRLEYFSGIAKLAFNEFVNDHISDTLRRASNIVNSEEIAQDAPEDSLEDEISDEAETGQRDIVTTVEEVEGYELVKTIVSEVVDPERVFMRDTKSYCGILLDDNNRRAICRLHFNSKNRKQISISTEGFNEYRQRNAVYYPIEDVNDIANFAEELKAATRMHLGESSND